MSNLPFSFRPANSARAGARSLSIRPSPGLSGNRREFSLELAAEITRARGGVLDFGGDDPEELLRRFEAFGGDRRFIQFCAATGSIANLIGWLRFWRPSVVLFDHDDDDLYALSRVEFTDPPRPSSRGREAVRSADFPRSRTSAVPRASP